MSGGIDVTVVIPTFDGADYLEECLASVAAQDLDRVEVLVIDDGSGDGTVAIAESFADRIAQLRVLRNETRLGPAANLQRCIDEARGAWIKPVFQDDTIEPGCLTAMRAARRRGVPVVVCARRYQYEDGVPEWRRLACDHLLAHALDRRFGSGLVPSPVVAELAAEMAAERVPQLNFIGEPVAILFERATAQRTGGVDTGYVQLWDFELVLRLALRRGIVVVDEPLATFRVHEGSETARNLLSGALFRTNVMDRVRLQVAYVADRGYRAVRAAADRLGPAADLTALALGAANAGRRLVDELPEADRAAAAAELEAVAAPLPAALAWGSEPERIASEAEVALFCIVSTQPSPELLPIRERPTVIPPFWPRLRQRVVRLLRIDRWWHPVLGPLLALALLQVGWRQVPPGTAFATVAALVASAVAVACFAHLVDDAADVAVDRAVHRPNLIGKMAAPARLATIGAAALAGLVPWAFVELDARAAALLAATYLLALTHAVGPLRRPDRSVATTVAAPVLDAAGAAVLPALFTVALLAPSGSPEGPVWLMVAGAVCWSFAFGVRTVLVRQVRDLEVDGSIGRRTVATRAGAPRTVRVVRTVLFPLELLGLGLLAATVATWSWGAVAVALGWVVAFHGARWTGIVPRDVLTRPLERGGFRRWYQLWPALGLAVALVVVDPAYLSLLALVVVLLARRIADAATVARREVVRERTRRWRASERPVPPADRLAAEAPPVTVPAPAPAAAPELADGPTPERPRRRPLARRALGAVRANQWWGHMLGPIVAFACLQLGWRQVPPDEGLVRVLALVASAIALAGYGYVVNDTADVVPDRRAGKRNAMAKLPAPARPVVIVAFAVAGALPWLVLPLEAPALAALAVIYVLPILYSLPPIRLKERDVLGPIADASNAFAVPALFTIALFAPLGDPTGPPGLMLAGALAWTYGFGLRAIVKHQIDDVDNDRASGTTTLVTRIGPGRALRVLRTVLFPVELVGLALLAATVATWSWGTVAVAVGYAVAFNGLRLTGAIDRGTATTTLDRGYWMSWYQVWPALVVSLGLAAWQPAYLALSAFVVVLLWPRVPDGLRRFRAAAAHELRRHRAAGSAVG